VGQTANATPADLTIANDIPGLVIPPASTWYLKGRVLAREPSTGDSKVWTLEVVYQRIGTGNPALIDSLTKTVVADSAGAASWDVTINTNNDLYSGSPSGYKGLTVQVTGEAATTINWIAAFEILHGGDGE